MLRTSFDLWGPIMGYAPQNIYQWLSAISVPVAGFAVKHAVGLAGRFRVLEALFNEKKADIEKLDNQQRSDGIKLAEHQLLITQVKLDLAGINTKLEPLPRISAALEALLPALQRIVPREEMEARFASVTQQIADVRHRD